MKTYENTSDCFFFSSRVELFMKLHAKQNETTERINPALRTDMMFVET